MYFDCFTLKDEVMQKNVKHFTIYHTGYTNRQRSSNQKYQTM